MLTNQISNNNTPYLQDSSGEYNILVILNIFGNVVHMNEEGRKLLGYDLYEVLGKSFMHFLIDEERVKVCHVFAELTLGYFPNTATNYWKSKNGQFYKVDWFNTCICSADKTIKYIVGVGRLSSNVKFRKSPKFFVSEFVLRTHVNHKTRETRACVNCRRDHKCCDSSRPCLRCRLTGKAATCVDAQVKKR